MVMLSGLGLAVAVLAAVALVPAAESGPRKVMRAGIIGCDTSHVIAFTRLLNQAKKPEFADIKVVAAYPGGSPDVDASRTRVKKFTEQLKDQFGVEIVSSIEELLKKVDVVLLESVDGRPHLRQAMPVFKAGKPLFIDKPMAGSLRDVIAIFAASRKFKVPCFSSSSLRFAPGTIGLRRKSKIGKILGCDAYSPCSLEPHHPDLFWYGVHGVETLFTIMGPGCESVTRTHTKDFDVVVGKWKDGRIGTFRGIRAGRSGYGATVFGTKGIVQSGKYEGYEPLVREIVRFFRTGEPPVAAEETIEIFAFMEAADESKRQGGRPVRLADVIAKAQE